MHDVTEGFQIRFDDMSGPDGCRFIEAESLDGRGVRLGEWRRDGEFALLAVPPTETARCRDCDDLRRELEISRGRCLVLEMRIAGKELPLSPEDRKAAEDARLAICVEELTRRALFGASVVTNVKAGGARYRVQVTKLRTDE